MMPDKMYLIRRDALRPYKRLNKKFEELFDMSYGEFKKFKDLEISNFK